MTGPALSIRNLFVYVQEDGDERVVVDGISFDLAPGEVLALVGESGCGKSKTAEAIMGLVPKTSGRVSADAIALGGFDLATMGETALKQVRGCEISMVFQEPLTALDPVFKNGYQLATQYRRHRGQSRSQSLASAQKILGQVGFADPDRIMQSYPHQLSGGMRQRLIIAMAMACKPSVLIADEPTTALDVTTQAQVLTQMLQMSGEAGTAILLITHDLGIVAQYCDRALVMHQGRLVENANVPTLFASPEKEYTKSLISSAREMSL